MVNRPTPRILEAWKLACLLTLMYAREVLLLGAPKVLPFSFPNRPKVLGRTSVMCSAADGTQPFTFSWLKDGSSVTDLKNVREEKKSDYSVLIIEPVEAVHAGNYTCIVKNKAGFDSHTAYLEVEAPPMWKSVPGNTDVVKGKELVLFCNAHGSPSPKEQRKEWTALGNNEAGTVVSPNGTLVLKSAQESQSGELKCSADNGIGRLISHIFAVKVRAPPEWKREPMDKSGTVGSTVHIDCLGSGSPAPRMSWYTARGDGLQQPISEAMSSRTAVYPNGTLVIQELDVTDSGQYTCTADNGVAPVLRKTITLKINAPPSWLREPQDVGGTLGTRLVIDCTASGSPAPVIRWFKLQDGTFPHSKKTPQPRDASENGSMVIPHIETQDAGQYVCEADNGIAPTLRKTVTVKRFLKYGRFSFSKNIPVGGKALVTCWITSGVQPVTFSWLKDGQSLNMVQGTRLKTESDYSVLLLEPVVPSHVGNYTCIAKNKFGFDSYTTVLEVECKHDALKMDNQRLTVHRNGTVIITQVSMDDAGAYACEAQNSVPPSVRHTVKVIVNGVINLISSSNGSLLIDDVSIDDAGQYVCEADNGIAPTASHSFTVTVNGETGRNARPSFLPPRIKPFSFPKVASKGEKISIVCLVSEGTLPFSFSWSKDGKELQTTDNLHVKAETQYSVVFINSVDERTAGNYTCIVKNIFGFDSYSAYLDVEAPPVLKKTTPDTNVVQGGSVTLSCLATGSPKPSVNWSRSAGTAGVVALAADPRMQASPNGTLLIEEVRAEDAGKYTCTAQNAIGSVSHSLYLHVRDAAELQTSDSVKVKPEPEYSVAFINSVDEKSAGNYTCIVKNIFGFDSYSAYLDVEAPPVLKKTTPDTNVVQGGSVTLNCQATGSPKPTVSWSRSSGTTGEAAVPAANARMQASPNGTLLIEDVAAEDTGKYTCTAQNSIGSVSHSLYLHVRAPPTIKPFSFAKVASKGEKVSILCFVSGGTPPFSFSWLKDGKEIQTTENVKVKTESDFSLTIIGSIDERSPGNYTCIVKNIFGFDTHSAYLDVEAPPVFKKTTADTNVVQGGSVVLSCQATGSPNPTVKWSRTISDAEDVAPTIQQIIASTKVSAGEKATAACLLKRGSEPLTFQWLRSNVDASLLPNVRVAHFEDTLLLVIDPAEAESSGNYTCAASNALGSDVQTVHIEVSVPPAWKKVPGDTEVREGYNRSFQCIAFGSPKPNVTWSKQKESRDGWMTMRADSRISFEASTMTIMDIQLSDTGTYSCFASNGVGPGITATFQLRVNVPARFEEKSTVVTARRTEVTRMKCQATGDQPLSIAWSKGSVKLDKRTSARYEVFETLTPDGLISELVIRDTDRSDGALYTCHTQNKYGKDDRKVKLIVQEVPGPPQDVRLKDVWSRSASVSWSPSYSGNSPISKYIVQYWRDHGTAHRLHELEVIGSLTYTMVRDLLPGTAYVLNLVAENAIGRGEPSRTVVFHTGEEEPEAAPVDILVEMKGPSTVYISWKAPPREHWNGHLLGYYIGYRPRDTESQFSYRRVEASPTNASHEYLLGGLQRGTEYTLVLKAYNSAGSGPASQEKTVRTMDGDVPEAPRLFVTGVTADTMTLRWVIRSSSDVTGFNIHYRTGRRHVAGTPDPSNVLGRGDPSAILLIRTESSASGHESSAIENKQADDEVPIYMDMAIMIPAGAILLAVLVILFSTCICIRKMKSTPRPVPEIMRYDPATLNTGTMMSQRYVEMEKMSEQDVPFATPYEGGTMRNGTELRGTLKERPRDEDLRTQEPDEGPAASSSGTLSTADGRNLLRQRAVIVAPAR
ncbi:hypothetical protein MTO96_036197 [Rhipicephalus appendiculatus]